MVSKIIWTETSIKDRYQIYTFWQENNKSNTYSLKLEQLFHQSAELLANFPKIGLNTDFRNTKVKIVSHFKIFYSVGTKSIPILRVWDTRQNPNKLKI